MANQHTLTIRLSQATERQLLGHIASRMENHMADMTAALDRLAASLAKEIAKSALGAKVADAPVQPADPEPGDGADTPADPETPDDPEQPVDPDQPVQ